MNYPFIEGISDIQETEALSGSRFTNLQTPRSQQLFGNFPYDSNYSRRLPSNTSVTHESQQNSPSYSDLRSYVITTLNSWGMKLSYLPENPQNIETINCFMELIAQKFKDQQNREQHKSALANALFEKNKYQSLLEQQKNTNAEKNKTIGRLQNSLNDLKIKMKQLEQVTKKERDEDKKMIAMLKSKNEQIVHEIKKKQQETNRIKQQMKKNIGEKGTIKNATFQVYEAFPKQSHDEKADKIEALTSKYEGERKNLMRQNLLLRQKLYDIRQEIVGFAQWVDANLFRQPNPNYKNKFVINHSLLFKKQSLVEQFKQIIENSKSGIKQVIGICQEGRKTFKSIKQYRMQKSEAKIYEENQSPNKQIRPTMEGQKRTALPMQKKASIGEQRLKYKAQQTPVARRQKNYEPEMELQDEDSELSMISHISAQEIVRDGDKFDKWDILLNHE